MGHKYNLGGMYALLRCIKSHLITELIQGMAISQQCAIPSVVYLLAELLDEPAWFVPVELGFTWLVFGATLAGCKA